MTFLLSVPLIVKTTLAAWIVIYGASWLFSRALPYVSAATAESAFALSYWIGRFWQVFPFVVAVIIAIVYWARLAHHVAYVVARRDA
jgi:hypothetical protein